MYAALHNLEMLDTPSYEDWDRVHDSVLIMEALMQMGVIKDEDGLLEDSLEGLKRAQERAKNNKPLRLDGPALVSLRSLMAQYADCLEVIPERTMLEAHRLAERKAWTILKST
jgi:hypothetical protein